MSRSAEHRRSTSCPAKVFLIGEYAVLRGGPAIVCAIAPRFSLSPGDSSREASFPSGSPADRLLAEAGSPSRFAGLHFSDPFGGSGGFGASTAQFAVCYRELALENGWPLGWREVRGRYRGLAGASGTPPSGADLVGQWLGGTTWFDSGSETAEAVAPATGALGDLLVFSAAGIAGRKVRTHEHLRTLDPGRGGLLSDERVARLTGISLGFRSALERGDRAAAGRGLSDYARELARAGLEHAATSEDRDALAGLPGVAGIKGIGALQADGVVLALEAGVRRERPRDLAAILATARARGLSLVCDGISTDGGIA